MSGFVLGGARLQGRDGLWDIAVDGARIAGIAPRIDGPRIEAAGGLVFPGYAETVIRWRFEICAKVGDA